MNFYRLLRRLAALMPALLLGAGMPLAAEQAPGQGYRVTQTVALAGEGGGDYLSLDQEARRLYVTHGDRVHVLDADSLEQLGTIEGTPHSHGVVALGKLGKGYITSGVPGSVLVFDLKSLKILAEIPSSPDTDGILYDPASGLVATFNGDSHNATFIDPATDKVVKVLDLGGAPEAFVSDNQGHLYGNLKDKSEVIKVSIQGFEIDARWPLAPGGSPAGLAMDRANNRLFVGCRNQLLAVMDAANGKVLQTLPIGGKVDATFFEPQSGTIFDSCGDGTLSVIHQDDADHYRVVENAKTEPGAKTMAYDMKTGRVFSSAARKAEAADGAKAQVVPGSFHVLAIEKASAPAPGAVPAAFSKIKHIIVIYQENWSFDGLYGKFPGADGLDQAGDAVKQVGFDGQPLASMPQAYLDPKAKVLDDRFPKALPVGPYDLTQYVPVTERTGDLWHRFYQEQYQIDGGKMDRFVAGSNNGGLTMSYVDASQLPEGKLAARYTLCDHLFHEAFGGSLLNHIFLVAMMPPVFPNAPQDLIAEVGPDGWPLPGKDGYVSQDGYAINDLDPAVGPHKPGLAEDHLVPGQDMTTIGERMSDKKVTWAWYSEGWDQALAGTLGDRHFTYHHMAFAYFNKYANGTPGSKQHLKDTDDLEAILDGKGELPQVSFVKFIGENNEHPHDSILAQGQKRSADLVEKILASRYGRDCAVLITYDENGGRWDHVAPPKGDRWGPGSRVPLIVISPFAKKGYVDHSTYTTASILRFIESRFGLEPLNERDGKAANLDNAFEDKE